MDHVSVPVSATRDELYNGPQSLSYSSSQDVLLVLLELGPELGVNSISYWFNSLSCHKFGGLEAWKSSLRKRFNMKQEVEHDQVTRGAGGKKAEAELELSDVALTLDSDSKRFKRVCVFCGSSSGNKDIFGTVALSLGRQLVITYIHLNLC